MSSIIQNTFYNNSITDPLRLIGSYIDCTSLGHGGFSGDGSLSSSILNPWYWSLPRISSNSTLSLFATRQTSSIISRSLLFSIYMFSYNTCVLNNNCLWSLQLSYSSIWLHRDQSWQHCVLWLEENYESMKKTRHFIRLTNLVLSCKEVCNHKEKS